MSGASVEGARQTIARSREELFSEFQSGGAVRGLVAKIPARPDTIHEGQPMI